ncbi:MAG: hypothetical protein P8103_05755 [Candidatus Thiodiazotropha sp.]|jgi:hypothetical protein
MSPIEIAFAVTLTLVGSIAGFYINRGLENLHLPKIGRTRRQAISGDWEGVYHQQANEKREAQEIVFRLSLKAGSRAIKGRLEIRDNTDYEFDIEGAFYHERYLRLNYTAAGSSAASIDFGAMFLVLADRPDTMSGLLAGYGSLSEGLINGTVDLRRV